MATPISATPDNRISRMDKGGDTHHFLAAFHFTFFGARDTIQHRIAARQDLAA